MSHQTRYQLDVTLLEDLHSGTGSTGSELDAVQMRDRHGRPLIRETHLKGLLREAGYELVALGRAKVSEVEALFGRRGADGRGRAICRSLRCEDNVQTIAWSASSRRIDDRGPREDLLRTREFVPAKTRFTGEIELVGPDLHELLAACVRRVTNLGARRRRGDGRIVTSFRPSELQDKTRLVGQPAPDRLRLRVILRLLEPACLATTGLPGNVVPTECYLRGQVIAAAFAGWALRRNLPAQALFFGAERPSFGPGLPLPNGWRPAASVARWEVMPIPLDVMSAKPPPQRRADLPWWAEQVLPPENATASNVPAGKPKRPGDREFLFRKGATQPWRRYALGIGRHMRNNAGSAHREEKEKAELFAQDEIAEETGFLVDIVFPDKPAASAFVTELADLFNGRSWLRIGRGGAPAEVAHAEFLAAQSWPKPGKKKRSLRVTLLSDLIARGPHLGFLDDLDAAAFFSLIDGTPAAGSAVPGIAIATALDTSIVYGFNAATGLPRPATLCLRRGSVIAVTAGNEAELANLHGRLLRRQALGERTDEGFGWFRIDAEKPRIMAPAQTVSSPDPEASRRETLLSRARRLANELREMAPEMPRRSQCHAQLEAFSAARSRDELLRAVAELEAHAGRRAGKAWGTARPQRLRQIVEAESAESFAAARELIVFAIGHLLRDERDHFREAG
jgi:hypothetical protein